MTQKCDMRVKVEGGYNTVIAETDDPALCGQIVALIASGMPTEVSIREHQSEIERVEAEASKTRSDKWSEQNAHKKTKEALAAVQKELASLRADITAAAQPVDEEAKSDD